MAGMKKKKTKTRGEAKKLSLQNISDLGGTEEDVKLLEDLPDSGSGSEAESIGEDWEDDTIKRDEIKDFLKTLDIAKHRPAAIKDDEDSKGEEEDGEKDKDNDNKPDQKESNTVSEARVKQSQSKATSKDQKNEEPETSTSKNKKKKEKNKYKLQHEEVSSTTKDPTVELRAHIRAYTKHKHLLVKPGELYDLQDSATDPSAKMPEDLMKQMETFAGKLLEDEISVFTKQREKSKKSDVRWMKTVLTSGTLADKIAALTVMIQESPLHNLAQLDTLISMSRKKNRRESSQATDALKDIFLTNIMPGHRKLKPFKQRNFHGLGQSCSWNKESMNKQLLMWYFESQLKSRYMEFVTMLEKMVHDSVLSTKQKAVSTIYNLLVEKPEQEKALLTLLINKVGDPQYKLAAAVSHLLGKLVDHHSNMKPVVVREVEHFLFRPNISDRAQYYTVCFLNQLKLSHDERDLAAHLIMIYFTFFKGFVKKGEVDGKMMGALLSGVNRAYPYSKLDEKVLNEQMDHLYKLVHILNFSTAVQALMLLFQVMDTSQTISERYYSALYRKLADPTLKGSSKQAVFLNLLYKSMKKDESDRRVKAFIKRLLQVCSYQLPHFICGALILLSEVLKSRPGMLSVNHGEEDSDEEEHFVDLPDPDDTPTETCQSETEIGDTPPSNDQLEAEKDDKHPASSKAPVTHAVKSSWVHRANLNHKSENVDYDPFHRNPLYCHAENECIWELEKLTAHFHPSVCLFARQVLKGESVHYTGDPLQDFTLIRFLDRFVYKNPKKREQIEERISVVARQRSLPHGVKSLAVTSDNFLKLKEAKVPVDDMFMHKYFQQKALRMEQKQQAEDESDTESVTDADFDNYLDKYEKNMDSKDWFGGNVDFSSEFGRKYDSDDDLDSDLDGDLSDEEVEVDDDALARAFKSEMEGLSDDEDDDEMSDFANVDEYNDELDADEEAAGDDDLGPGDDDDDDDEEAGMFNEEDIEFSDGDDEFGDFAPKGNSKKRKTSVSGMGPSQKKRKRSRQDGDDILATAEEFADMLDETGSSRVNITGADALSNKDKAHAKQLNWEVERDRWIKGHDRKHFQRKKGQKAGRGSFKKQGPGGSKNAFKGKKGRR